MDDSEVRRLEDRIEAAEERGRLRLEASLARIEGVAALTNQRMVGIEDRIDGVQGRIVGLNDRITGLHEDIRGLRQETKAQFQWVIAAVIAVGLGVSGLLVGVKQVWTAGVQSGQALQSAPGSATSPSATPAPTHAGEKSSLS